VQTSTQRNYTHVENPARLVLIQTHVFLRPGFFFPGTPAGQDDRKRRRVPTIACVFVDEDGLFHSFTKIGYLVFSS
jgi:hypothetical protein